MAEIRNSDSTSRRRLIFFAIVGVAGLATLVGVGLLMNIFERKQEAKNPFYRVVELNDDTDDPAIWGKNFPLQYDAYRRTVDQQRTRYGGSAPSPRTPPAADPRALAAPSPGRAATRPRGCERWGRVTPSPPTSGKSAATRTCWRIRPLPNVST